MAGHSSIDTTARFYINSSKEENRKELYKKISDLCPNAEVSYSVDYGLTKESGQSARNTLKELISNYVK